MRPYQLIERRNRLNVAREDEKSLDIATHIVSVEITTADDTKNKI